MSDKITGTVKFFKATEGFGFIEQSGGGADVFVHVTDIRKAGYESLAKGDRVEFIVAEGRNGRSKATAIKIIN